MTDIASLRRELLHRRLATAAGRPASRDIERRTTLEASLSHAQERLWFLEQLGVVGGSYNIGLAVRLAGRLDAAALAAALSEVVRRHEALRTRFASRDEAAVQVIDPPWPVTLEPLAVAPDEAGEQARAMLQQRFDLAHDRLLRVALLRLAADRHVLVLAMHHIVSDGWSIGVLVREVEALYAAFAQGRPSPLPELPVQYADYAVWQRRWLADGALERQLAYWTRQLAGAPAALELPTDRPRPAVPSFRAAVHHLPIAPARHNVPQQSPLIAGLAVEPFDTGPVPAKFDLELSMVEADGALAASIVYATDLFDAATIARLAGHFARLLDAIVADPERRIAELPLLGEAERRQLAAWTGTVAPYSEDR